MIFPVEHFVLILENCTEYLIVLNDIIKLFLNEFLPAYSLHLYSALSCFKDKALYKYCILYIAVIVLKTSRPNSVATYNAPLQYAILKYNENQSWKQN